MQRTFLILSSALLMLLATNAWGDGPPTYQLLTEDLPLLNKQNTVYLGDKMMEQVAGEYRTCLVPKKTLQLSSKRGSVIHKKNEPICKPHKDSKIFLPGYANATGLTKKAGIKHVLPVSYITKKGITKLCLKAGGLVGNVLCIENIEKNDLEFSESYFSRGEDSFQRSIEYAGKQGSVLKFLYSEFDSGLARTAFNREFQIDLNEGDIAAYKGAVIKIHKATNVDITYTVIRHFRSQTK